ncbi:MAG TPA: DUF4382 domain-containing protein [Sphingobacterium sp.]|uniref:DUF4382 domain-containing protein n=1 Tax=Candidatus Sphingobacterium stercoripullorum TaxID=2838759 RepID=A0A9D2AYA7_9SPHI|nr:DUF4382 domain-containing protein [Candidatus Sphingobacterium stercoripullorum]HLR00369.1 DUF4382 domain-containing protein [Sphingobacterium sp.]
MRTNLFLIILVGLIGLTSSCQNEDSPRGTTPISIKMTDAPAFYDAIFLNIKEIEIRTESGKEIVEVKLPPFNILDYNMGEYIYLVEDFEVPSGRLEEVRFILHEQGNTIIVDGEELALTTPSGQSSGWKIKVQDRLAPGVAYTLALDFDAARSIHTTGSGKYMLHPVVRAIPEALSGSISGEVIPAESNSFVYLLSEQDTLAGTLVNAEGRFYFPGIQEGIYDIAVDPTEPMFDPVLEEGVIVENAKKTEVVIDLLLER